jgi:hypothetical protein
MYDGDNHYKSCFDVAVLKVNKVPTSICSSDMTTIYNAGKYLIAVLKDANGNPIAGATISVNLKGAKPLKTDNNGQVKFTTDNLNPKDSYVAKITFAGDDNYVHSSTIAKVTVKKATPKLTAKAKTFKRTDKTKKYAVTLKDNIVK